MWLGSLRRGLVEEHIDSNAFAFETWVGGIADRIKNVEIIILERIKVVRESELDVVG
jgi:hypothetical protein